MKSERKRIIIGNERNRLRFIAILGGFVIVLLLARFFYIQIIHNRQYASLGENQSIREASIYPTRGQIFDRTGIALALNANVDKDNLKSLAMILKDEGGISLKKPVKRIYPMRSLAGQLLGFVGRDGYGLSGVEYGYDRFLYGEAGWSLARYDAKSRRVFELDLPVKSPTGGRSVQLTLSVPVQEIVEECLRDGIKACGAPSGAVIIMDPFTGDILGMASYPYFDPNFFTREPDGALRNNALGLIYEPGSTFKIVAAAAALEEGLFNEEDIIATGEGELKVYDQIIHDTHKNGNVTFRNSIAISSNIAFAKIATVLGNQRFYKYVRNFGFGQKTGIGLPGEEPGLLKPLEKWSGRTLMTMAIGQEVSVTLLQMAAAYSAVANGGVLMAPRMVCGFIDSGRCVEKIEVRPIRRLMSERTARRLTECLTGVVEKDEGTGVSARIDGVNIAGKTGTAQKIDPVTKLYQSDKFVASFAGYFPAEKPELLCIVMLDEPKTIHYGGLTAAPVFKNIVTRILHSQELPYGARIFRQNKETLTSAQAKSVTPDFQNPTRENIAFSMKGPNKMPQLLGMPLRIAILHLQSHGVKIKIIGSGIVMKQVPESGILLQKNVLCVLEAG